MRSFLRWTGRSLLAISVVVLAWSLIPVRPTIPKLERRETGHSWELASGHRIAYVKVSGTGSGGPLAPVVVTHGGPGGYIHSSYVRAFGRLAETGRDVYLYDQLGSGLSDRLRKPRDYSFKRQVDVLEEIITVHLGGGPVVLVGQSYGGQVISYFAARHPKLVAAAVLTSPGEVEPLLFDETGWINERKYPVPADLEFREPFDVADEMGIGSWGLRPILAIALSTLNLKWMPDDEADGVLNSIASRITKGMVCDPENVEPEEGGGGWYSHGWSNWFDGVEDWRERLSISPVPLLVVQGQCDYLPYAGAYEHADLAPNGRYEFIEGAGHVLWWEREDALVKVLVEFLSSESGSARVE